MKMLILDPETRKRLIRKRRLIGADHSDEVWEGVYVMSPEADNQHQDLVLFLAESLNQANGGRARGRVFTGVNVSDRETQWKRNFRVPDVAVFLPGNPAQDRKSHWFGGPDFAVEIISKYDRSRRKLPFYAKVGIRELLLVDRSPWTLELYRLQDNAMELVGRSTPETATLLSSVVLPVSFRLVPDTPDPRIEVISADGTRMWST